MKKNHPKVQEVFDRHGMSDALMYASDLFYYVVETQETVTPEIFTELSVVVLQETTIIHRKPVQESSCEQRHTPFPL